MAEPFGDQAKDDESRRPAPTIEGTATEISVEPVAADQGRAAPDAAPSAPETAASGEQVPEGPDEAGAFNGGDGGDDDDEAVAEPRPAPDPMLRGAPEPSGFLGLLVAGLLGGVIGALAVALLWSRTPTHTAPSADVAALQHRLAQLEAAPAESADAKAVAALKARLDAVEAKPATTAPNLAPLGARVDHLEAALNALANSANANNPAAAAATEKRIGEAEQKLQARIDQGLNAQAASNSKSLADLQQRVTELNAKLGALAEAKLSSDDQAPSPDIAKLEQRIAKLEAALPGLAKAIDQGAASARMGAAAIAFANLRQAVNSGRPYDGELAALGTLGVRLGDLGALPAHAQSGIPALAALTATFASAAEASLTSASPPSGSSFLDSIITSAKSAIKVRRVDEDASGSDPASVIARAEADLKQGDLAAAVKEITTLPAPARAAFAGWLDDASARIDAEATLASLQSSLLAALGGSAPAAKPGQP